MSFKVSGIPYILEKHVQAELYFSRKYLYHNIIITIITQCIQWDLFICEALIALLPPHINSLLCRDENWYDFNDSDSLSIPAYRFDSLSILLSILILTSAEVGSRCELRRPITPTYKVIK